MTKNQELLLTPEESLSLSVYLNRQGLFGIKEKPEEYITLKSGRKSPHYLDLRPGISSFETRQTIAKSMFSLAIHRALNNGYSGLDVAYDYFAGTPEAFTTYAASVADLARMGVLQPRVDTEKTSGNKTPILGKYMQGARLAEFDDVVTDGESKISTIQALGASGLQVVDYFVVLDRQEGGAAEVQRATSVEVTPALTVAGMAVMLFAENEINARQVDNIAQYLEQYGDPRAKATMDGAF